MTSLFSDILNISLTSSVLILAITLLRGVLKKAPKFYFCALWGIAGLRLILPFSLENTYSPIPSYYTVEQTFYNISETQDSSAYFSEILTYIWLSGMVFMAIYGIISYLRIRLRVLPSIKLQDNVYLCDGIDSPFILGTFKPKIYVPSDLDTSRLDDVLRHEKAHLKRGDHFWKPLGFLILILHWFNPVVWIAYVLLCRDIEKACDEKVISKMGSAAKISYLESLVVCSVHRKGLALCPVAFGEIGVKARVKLILDYKRPTLKLLVLCTLISCLVVTFLFTSSSNTYFDAINESMEAANNEKQIDYEKLQKITAFKMNSNDSGGSSSSKVNKVVSVKSGTTSNTNTNSTVVYPQTNTNTSQASSNTNSAWYYPKPVYQKHFDYIDKIYQMNENNRQGNFDVIQIFP